MNKRRMWFIGALGVALLTITSIPKTSAFKLETHETINRLAADTSGTDRYMKSELALKDGLATTLRRKADVDRLGREWIVFGGRAEDLYDDSEWFGALYRSRNHFHNPLLSWDASGLRTLGFCPPFIVRGESSPRWTQNADQGQSGRAAWADARKAYLEALTLGASADRDDAWSWTFQILGQQMHLVTDLAVPAHTRNDIHCPVSDRFEAWALKNRARVDSFLGAPLQPVDPMIFSINVPLRDQVATVPIARLMDTDQYDGTNPAVTTSPTIGLAEYANANFFSDHTMFGDHRQGDRSFRYPSSAGVQLGGEEDVPGGGRRRYFLKTQDGDTGYRLAVPSALYESLPEALRGQETGLDDKVLEDYGARLLPRAASYSAALLDYFFRGKLEAMIEAHPDDAEKLQVRARNASSEPLGGGTLAVYGDYAGGERRTFGLWAIREPIAPGADLPSVGFSPDKPIPARFMVVYEGDLGEEKKDSPPGFRGAVIGKAAKYGGVLEELIVFRTPENTYDVYYRNQFQITLLGLSADLPVVPGYGVLPPEVRWGVDGNHFFLKGYENRRVGNRDIRVPVYLIYRINRPDDSASRDEPVQARLVRTIIPPETPLPYRWREIWVNLEQANRYGQMVYPYGMVFSNGGFHALPSEQEVLSEDLGNGGGLEIYALFQAEVLEDIEYVDGPGGSGRGLLGVSLIIQASTGAVVYEDPISGSYKGQAAAAVSHGDSVTALFYAWPRTWIVSWSDKDVKKRRWVTQLQVDDFYQTDDARYFVENSVQTVLIEDGQPKFSITPKQTYVEIVRDRAYTGFYPSALVPTMSSEKWLWVDEPDMFTVYGQDEKADVDILRRTQYLMSAETGVKQKVGEWTPPDSTQYLVAPKIREMVMLQPGFLYAHGDPVYAIPVLSGYDEDSREPLAQDLTSEDEKQKFISFLLPDGRIDPAFTTAGPLMEDPDLRGRGRVRSDSPPPGFQAVLDTLSSPNPSTKVSWHVVPDPDLVPAGRR